LLPRGGQPRAVGRIGGKQAIRRIVTHGFDNSRAFDGGRGDNIDRLSRGAALRSSASGEQQQRASYLNAVAVGQPSLAHLLGIDEAAIGAAQIDEQIALVIFANFGVAARNLVVADVDRIAGFAAER